jgi:hypothetical protein
MFASPEDLDRNDARERVDKVMIRRGKETIFEINSKGELVKKFKDRKPHPIEIDFSSEEKALYEAVSGYTAEGWTRLSRRRKITQTERNIGKFLLTLVQKRMVSSIAALRETLHRRINSIVEDRAVNRIEGFGIKEIKKLLKDYRRNQYMEDEDKELVERYLETHRVQSMYAERTNEIKTLRSFLEKADHLINTGMDSKLSWLTEFLKQLFAKDPKEKVIIFTEYRDTLNYLKKKLENKWFLGPGSLVIIHGGMPLGENEDEEGSKLKSEKLFNDPDTRILLATDAASEGLNLQRHCHIMINYELPWNPNRLEQRIGRIHRYGQKRVAQIYNLMIRGSKEAEIFKRLQDKIEIIRKQLGNMAEVLGVLERISLDDIILSALDRSLDIEDVGKIAEKELKRMERIAEEIRKTQFLSGCRQFTKEDIFNAQRTISDSQKAIPTHKDVQAFVETFLRVFGDDGKGHKDGRKLHPTNHNGIYRLLVPMVIQDDKLPKQYRVAFDREVALKERSREEEPEFLAFGHPLLDRMIHYCRETKASDLGGKLACMVTDYAGLPGVIFNFLLSFEDKIGRIIREELQPVFINQDSEIQPELGQQLFLSDAAMHIEPNPATLINIRGKISDIQAVAESHIRSRYQSYYKRVEKHRNDEIAILLEDLKRFDQGIVEDLTARLKEVQDDQLYLFNDSKFKEGDSARRGQQTRLENQIKMHKHRMQERRTEVENMRLGAFPAPELLNMVIVLPA